MHAARRLGMAAVVRLARVRVERKVVKRMILWRLSKMKKRDSCAGK